MVQGLFNALTVKNLTILGFIVSGLRFVLWRATWLQPLPKKKNNANGIKCSNCVGITKFILPSVTLLIEPNISYADILNQSLSSVKSATKIRFKSNFVVGI